MRWIVALPCLLVCVPAPARAQSTARFADPPSERVEHRASQPAVAAPRTVSTPPQSWARSAARGLIERAQRLEQRGDAADAMRVYNEAIRMDPTFGPAYLGLGRLRHAQRDFHEAERLYGAAVRLPDSAAEALERRARVRRDLGRDADAFADLRAAIELDPGSRERMKTLATWYVERKAWPAALGVWRRLAAELEARGASDELEQARVQIRALSMLAGDSDPVAAGHQHPSWVRRSISTIARRR